MDESARFGACTNSQGFRVYAQVLFQGLKAAGADSKFGQGPQKLIATFLRRHVYIALDAQPKVRRRLFGGELGGSWP